MLKQPHSLLRTKLRIEACTRLCSFPKPLGRRYQLQQTAPEDGLGQTPAWHVTNWPAHAQASPKFLISHPRFWSSHQLGVKKTEGRDLTPQHRLKKKKAKKQRLQSIGRTKILIFSFLLFFFFFPSDFKLTTGTKLQVKNCRLFFKTLPLILLLESFDLLKRIKE